MDASLRLPYGYDDNVTCTTDRTGRIVINWPEGCRGTVISRELLDDIVEGKNNCQRWISVEERLPEEDRLVLWYRPDERWPVTSGRFERPHRVNYGGALCVPLSEGRYTHWMPLPAEPPEVN